MAGTGIRPVASLPVAAFPASGSITVSGTLYSPATSGAVYPGSTFIATGGTAPYTYTAVNLPTGLSINSSSGVVGGTTTASPGSYGSIVITATDALSNTGSSPSFTIVVLAAGVSKWPGHAQRMHQIWWRPTKRAQYRRRKTTQFAPQPNLDVFKFNGWTVLSFPDTAVSVFKVNSYVVLEYVNPTPRPFKRWLRDRRHARDWRWLRAHHGGSVPKRNRPIWFAVS